MSELFSTPLRSAALGVLIVAFIVLLRGMFFAKPFRPSVLILSGLAVGMVAISEGLQ